jgi:hypothetical protein
MLLNQFGYGSDTSGLTQNWLIENDCLMHNALSHRLDEHQQQREALRIGES